MEEPVQRGGLAFECTAVGVSPCQDRRFVPKPPPPQSVFLVGSAIYFPRPKLQ